MRKDLLQMSLMLVAIEFRRKTGTFLSHVSHRSLHGSFNEVKLQMSGNKCKDKLILCYVLQ